MLKLLRKKGVAKKLIWIVAILIIISFGFLGTAYLLNDGGGGITHAGRIFGKKVSFEDFEKTAQQVQFQSIMRYGDKYKEVREFIDFDSETWDRLILLEEAKRRDIKVSDEEVVQTIQQYPFFQREGKFDTLLYNDVVKFIFRTEPRSFEESIRDQIKIEKLYQEVASEIQLTGGDVYEAYKKANEKAQVNYALIKTQEAIADVKFSQNELRTYFEENQGQFVVPPSIKAQYIHIPTTDENLLEKETLAQNIRSEYQHVPDLKYLAEQNSLDMQETEYFSKDTPVQNLGWSLDILNDVFKLDLNEISPIYETDTGFYLISIVDKKEAYIPPFNETVDSVREALLQSKSQAMAKEMANQYLKTIQTQINGDNAVSFEDAVQTLNINLHQTPVFSRGQYLPNIGISKDFQEAAFSLSQENPLSDVLKTSDGFAILYLEQYVPIDEEKYEEEKEDFAQTLINEMGTNTFNNFLIGLRQKAELEDNISKLKQQ